MRVITLASVLWLCAGEAFAAPVSKPVAKPVPPPSLAGAYLYVTALHSNSTQNEESRTLFSSMSTCLEALRSARIAISSGGDSENIVVMWCGGSKQAAGYYDGKRVWSGYYKETPR